MNIGTEEPPKDKNDARPDQKSQQANDYERVKKIKALEKKNRSV